MGENMEKITEIFVVLENRPSTLGELCSYLAENKVNIEAIGVFQDAAKLYVKNANKAMKILSKADYTTDLRDVLKVELENRPGALAEVATKLGNKGVNIEYCYGTIAKKAGSTVVILDVSDIDRAMKILK
jgi:hypothetical protein